jgi:hypothetical protein
MIIFYDKFQIANALIASKILRFMSSNLIEFKIELRNAAK